MWGLRERGIVPGMNLEIRNGLLLRRKDRRTSKGSDWLRRSFGLTEFVVMDLKDPTIVFISIS
jgi:hypothetical protein